MNHFITSIKYFLLSTFIVSSIFLNDALFVSAQMITPQSVLDEAGDGQNINTETQIASDIFLPEPTFEDREYIGGDIVQVKLPITNNDNVDYPDLTLSARISVFTKDGAVRDYGYQNNLINIFLPRKSNKDVFFEYKIPEVVGSSEGDTIMLEIQMLRKTGETLGNTGKFIKIKYFNAPVEILGAFIKVNDQTYGLQEGPTVPVNQPIEIATIFSNTQNQEIKLFPKLTVYSIDSSGPIIETKEYGAISVISSEETQSFGFDVPKIIKPGTYAGELSFVDEKGKEQTPFVVSRWIVGGDSATISSVSIDKTSVKKGEKVIVDVAFTGPPQDIDTGTARDVGVGTMRVELFNEKNESIGLQEKEVNFSVIRDTVNFEISTTESAKSITAHVVASKDGNELASYKTNLTNPEIKVDSLIVQIMSLVVLIIILLLVLFIYKKIINKKILTLSLFIFIFFGTVQTTFAEYSCINDLCATSDFNRRDFTVGENMGWNVSVQPSAYACKNQGGNTQVDWKIHGANASYTGWFKSSYGVTDDVAKEYAKPTGTRGSIASWVHGEAWRATGLVRPANADATTQMYAPNRPGVYTLTVWTYQTARFKDSGSDGKALTKGPIREAWNFTVWCPAGQIDNGAGYCVNPPVAGACNSNPVIWSCASGTADNGNSDASNVWWRCAGSNGGADAWCSIPLAPAPTGISTQCSPAGNAVAMYWTNQPGYDRVYFRNHDNSAGAYYGYLDDYQNNWAYLTGITPGHSYNWWIHTRRWDGLWSAAVGEGYVCSVQQPSNLKVSCSADGRTATFSWTNPGAYNRVYFRNHDYTGGYDVAYGDNNDVWGNTYTINGITPGNSYGWWIHTRDAVGNYGPAVSGNFTCSAAPVDQCVNVGGVQTTVPASANKNTDGTCSCWAGKHFEGALCVNDTPPVVPTLSVSCSASSVVLNSESKFEASVQNSTGAVTYKWKEKDNTTYISGATNSIFKRTYSTAGSHRLYIEAKDDKSTITNFCNATVDCDSSHFEGQKVCDANTGIESTWSCSTNGWSESKGSCSGTTPGTYTGVNPEVGTFTFTPEIVADTSGKCGITLSATNVSSCTLTAPGATPIFIPGSLGAISKINEKIISVGRYNLSCTGMGVGAVTKQFGFKTCSLNADVRER